MKKIILHLCADLGSDSRYYQIDTEYDVILVGKNIGVENFVSPKNVHGIIANPPCTEFSNAKRFGTHDIEKGMYLVNHCLRIIKECNPKWWALENPATGKLREILGKPKYTYQPWEYGSPWTKKTALWGEFNIPKPLFNNWVDVPKNEKLYQRKGYEKPRMTKFHKSAINLITEFEFAKKFVMTDADFRSLCSQGFAKAFYDVNK